MSEALKLEPQFSFQFVILKGPHTGQRFSFSKDTITIGRSPENDIVLIDDPSISRSHVKIEYRDNEVELTNLSSKNVVVVNGEKVQKWKLTNETSFVLGDTEIQILMNLGPSVVSVKPKLVLDEGIKAAGTAVSVMPKQNPPPSSPSGSSNSNSIQVVGAGHVPNAGAQQNSNNQNINQNVNHIKAGAAPGGSSVRPPSKVSSSAVVKTLQSPAVKSGVVQNRARSTSVAVSPRSVPGINTSVRPGSQPAMGWGAPHARGGFGTQRSVTPQKKFKFIHVLIAAVILIGAYIYLSSPASNPSRPTAGKTLLTYNDQVEVLLKKDEVAQSENKREMAKTVRDSIEMQKFEENFSRAMRDFQLGNYSSAQSLFQMALNYNPEHALAKNYLYLSKIRFDEVVKAKMILGDGYYQKQNYRMCASMFRQVIDMLQGRPKDTNLVLAESMHKKCSDAAEGIF